MFMLYHCSHALSIAELLMKHTFSMEMVNFDFNFNLYTIWPVFSQYVPYVNESHTANNIHVYLLDALSGGSIECTTLN